jgi:hypothetical protein
LIEWHNWRLGGAIRGKWKILDRKEGEWSDLIFGAPRLVLLSVVAQAWLCNFLCVGSFASLLPAKPLMAISGKSRLLCAGFRTEAHHRRRVAEGGL